MSIKSLFMTRHWRNMLGFPETASNVGMVSEQIRTNLNKSKRIDGQNAYAVWNNVVSVESTCELSILTIQNNIYGSYYPKQIMFNCENKITDGLQQFAPSHTCSNKRKLVPHGRHVQSSEHSLKVE